MVLESDMVVAMAQGSSPLVRVQGDEVQRCMLLEEQSQASSLHAAGFICCSGFTVIFDNCFLQPQNQVHPTLKHSNNKI